MDQVIRRRQGVPRERSELEVPTGQLIREAPVEQTALVEWMVPVERMFPREQEVHLGLVDPELAVRLAPADVREREECTWGRSVGLVTGGASQSSGFVLSPFLNSLLHTPPCACAWRCCLFTNPALTKTQKSAILRRLG